MGAVAERITLKLTQRFSPSRLDVSDDSDRHHGHAGHREGGESHFNLVIESAVFRGLTRVQRQRLINETLATELAGPIHALSIKALAPGES